MSHWVENGLCFLLLLSISSDFVIKRRGVRGASNNDAEVKKAVSEDNTILNC